MRFGTREILFIALLLALPIAAYFFVFEPRNVQNNEKSRELEQKEAKLAQLDEEINAINNLDEEIERISEAIKVFEMKLPDEREVDVMLKQIWELASQNDLTAKSVRTDKPITTTHYTELPILLVISGGFDDFYRFMLALEKLHRIKRIGTMKLTKLSKGGEGMIEADMVLSIFFESKHQNPVTAKLSGARS